MKKITGILLMIFAFSIVTIAQTDDKKQKIKDLRKGEQKLQTVKGEVEEAKSKSISLSADKYKNEKQKAEAQVNVAKEKYKKMAPEKIEALDPKNKVVAKEAIIEAKVNASDMKAAMNAQRIAGIEARLNKAVSDGTMTKAEFEANMAKVAKAKESLTAYKKSIKAGKSLLK